MDPITNAIVAALTKLAEPAVKDAYESLKSLLTRKAPKAAAVVQDLEDAPDSAGRRLTLEEEIATSGVVQDPEIMAAVRTLGDKTGVVTEINVKQTVSGERHIFSGTGPVNVTGK